LIKVIYYIVVIICGLLVGSFLNVCICRIPRKESILKKHSHCNHCGNKIYIKYPIVQLLTAFTYATLLYKYDLKLDFFVQAYLMTILINVFFIDIEHRIIPNVLVICGFIGGVLLICCNLFYSIEIYMDRAWWNPVVGIFTGSGFLFLVSIVGRYIYKTHALGMGDIKLFAVIGAFLGWKMTLFALAASFLLAGLFGFVSIVKNPKSRKEAMPLGPYIVLGTYVTIMWGWKLFDLQFKV